MLCIEVLSDSSWTIILIDIVVSDQVCVLYASSRKGHEGEGRSVLTYLLSLGQYSSLASYEHAEKYWQLLMSEDEGTFILA